MATADVTAQSIFQQHILSNLSCSVPSRKISIVWTSNRIILSFPFCYIFLRFQCPTKGAVRKLPQKGAPFSSQQLSCQTLVSNPIHITRLFRFGCSVFDSPADMAKKMMKVKKIQTEFPFFIGLLYYSFSCLSRVRSAFRWEKQSKIGRGEKG